METISSEPETPSICAARREILEQRVSLSSIGRAALSTREIAQALALGLKVPQDLLPPTRLGNAALVVEV